MKTSKVVNFIIRIIDGIECFLKRQISKRQREITNHQQDISK